MRPISFRAWHPNTHTMIVGNANRAVIDFEGKVITVDNISGSYVHPDGVILMQFTGLKDKNGKDVYEGDIIRWGVEDECLADVRWDDKTARFVMYRHPRIGSKDAGLVIYDGTRIIGNVWENPELLTQNTV